MSGEKRFIDSLGEGIKTVLPGGADIKGEIKTQDTNYIHEFFNCQPVCSAKVGAGAATGTGGDENLMVLNDSIWEYHMLGTQTIVAPIMGAGGVDGNSLDQTDNDGVEYCLGINAVNKGVFTVGTSEAFYAKMKFSIADVSGTDDCVFGFRKVEAYQANVDDYDEMAAMNVNAGNILFNNILNAGATTATDTTDNWADAETHELAVYVSDAGVVTYTIDGLAPTVTVEFTFDDAEVVVPFLFILNASDVAGAIVLKEFECGLQ